MSVRIRLARGGTKKRPFYRIVATESRDPRDGRFLEKLGTYNPILPSESPERLVLREERLRYWLGVGAQPSDRVARFLDSAGITQSATRWRGTGKRAQETAAQKAEAEAAAAAAAPAAGSVPAAASAAAVEPEGTAAAAAEPEGAKAEAAEPSPSSEPEPAAAETAEDQPAKPAADAS
jgi:small subunit ribosomal protein S16